MNTSETIKLILNYFIPVKVTEYESHLFCFNEISFVLQFPQTTLASF
jgi:hypothetical protein